LLCGGGTSSVERRATEGETIPHPEIADKVVGGLEERKSGESLLCQRILESIFRKILANRLLESECVDSKILITIRKPLRETPPDLFESALLLERQQRSAAVQRMHAETDAIPDPFVGSSARSTVSIR
jgi:hypothetical protein